ncbi:hypothetical protein AB5J55_43990 [Streptomyces sp. R11]|uniref:Lipoprotein n=1 Tax=Streptomyces sp. R11 TaxID=3238625 RepID=A0AB39NGS0_9ACTN
MRSRYSGRLVLAAAAACALAVTATGCGGSEAKVASATQGSSSAGATNEGEPDSEVARYAESQRKVVACLRKEGVDVPDPDARGEIDTTSLGNWKQDAATRQAMEKCQPLGLPVPDSIREALEPTQSPEDAKKNRRYATCMQENGAPDFPDVDEKGNFSDGAWNRTAAAQRAESLCYKEVFGVDLSARPPAAG